MALSSSLFWSKYSVKYSPSALKCSSSFCSLSIKTSIQSTRVLSFLALVFFDFSLLLPLSFDCFVESLIACVFSLIALSVPDVFGLAFAERPPVTTVARSFLLVVKPYAVPPTCALPFVLPSLRRSSVCLWLKIIEPAGTRLN